ncbi:MAG: ABC transporter ATP-binding protein [Ignavibacteriales bacterium]|nr:MAG: ABC transporter ATP-binding protein [Ignavibacteriales bacterium]
MKLAINIEELHKSYPEAAAVNGISLNVKQGEMFGLVGPDGAGKTTTIRVVCGLLKPDKGVVTILDLDITKNRKDVQNQIGYLSQKFSLYGDLSIDENIEFFADIHDVKNFKQRRDELLSFTRLTAFRKRLAEKLSGGMKQKLALACSLIHTPKILFLDEPTTGVDPVSRRDFWKILSDLQKDGITIFMTTPYLDEAERCNRVALMNNGKIITADTPSSIKKSIERSTLEIICSDIKSAYELLRNEKEIEAQIFGDRINLMFKDHNKEFDKIKSLLTSNGISITSSRVIPPSLENVFIHLVKKETTKINDSNVKELR